ncbi:hypothetical protein [Catellatospora citrea]|uniref:Uncharacterized protein n=1 Tax=Catellatospora citrea TaxID=53366 RepID=A0A8J3P066_9ACTN|nr:hypothetical protein [Catellatospora citrea]RKE05724.1 hypothetical protein C8E86_0534 [Catellatospora citrea]GIF97085.1 hypothetical protein Cci01nite_21790 [Catellatospora citrea]
MTQLEVAYRRLLLCYPRSFRRERGLEVVTTLMDAAEPGRTKPTRTEAVNLILSGLTWRFRLPDRLAYRFAAVVVALFIGLAASAVASEAVWRASPTMPTDATVEAIGSSVTALAPVQGPFPSASYSGCDRADTNEACESLVPAGADPVVTHTWIAYQVPGAEVNAWVDQARDRFTADGWQLGRTVYSRSDQAIAEYPEQTIFWAAKGDLVVRIMGDPTEKYASSGIPNVVIGVHQQAPPMVTVAAVAGLLLGVAVGWAVAAWALRAFQRHTTAGRVAMLVAGAPGLCIAAVAGVAALVLAYYYATALGWSHQDSRFPYLVLTYDRAIAVAGGVSLLLSAAIAVVAPRVRTSVAETSDGVAA